MHRALNSEAVTPGSAWTTEVFARDDAPPLRVVCRCLSRHTQLLDDAHELFVALWECRKGGFVVTHSTPDGLGETAAAVEDPEAAAVWLESYCAGLGPLPLAAPGGISLLGLLADLSRRDTALRCFLALAGDALDDWQALPMAAGAAP